MKDKNTNPYNSLVSVVIPVYNAESFIAGTIESVLSQTYKPIEVIAVNDGSTDSSLTILKRYRNIKIINQANQGVSSARNTGIKESKGDFIAFIDADDLWDKTKISKQMDIFYSNPDLSIVTTNLTRIDKNGIAIDFDVKIKIPLDIEFDPYQVLLSKGNPFIMSSAVVNKSACLSVNGFSDIRLSADYDFWIRLAAQEHLFFVMSEKLTFYRELGDSLLHGSLEKEFGAQLNIFSYNISKYTKTSGRKRKAKIYYDWADAAFYTNDKSAFWAARKSIVFDPLNFKIYLLILRGLLKKLMPRAW